MISRSRRRDTTRQAREVDGRWSARRAPARRRRARAAERMPAARSRPRSRWIDQHLGRGRAILGGDAGGRHAARFDRDGKAGLVDGRIVGHHLAQMQFRDDARSSARVISPPVSRRMKSIAPAVTIEAATIRSPSFSRLVVELMTTILPARMSTRASSMVSNGEADVGLSRIRKDVLQALEALVDGRAAPQQRWPTRSSAVRAASSAAEIPAAPSTHWVSLNAVTPSLGPS